LATQTNNHNSKIFMNEILINISSIKFSYILLTKKQIMNLLILLKVLFKKERFTTNFLFQTSSKLIGFGGTDTTIKFSHSLLQHFNFIINISTSIFQQLLLCFIIKLCVIWQKISFLCTHCHI